MLCQDCCRYLESKRPEDTVEGYSCPSCIGVMGPSRNLFSKDTKTEEKVLQNLARLSWFWPFLPSFGLGLADVGRCKIDYYLRRRTLKRDALLSEV